MTTQHFKLEKLNCPSCITHIEAMEDDVPGIHKIDASYKKQSMKVDYDEATQSPEGIMAAVSEMGYIAIPHHEPIDDGPEEKSLWNKLFR